LGLKTITFKVGGDDSGAIFDVFNLSGMDGQLETLRGILRKCKCNIQVAMDWDWAPHEGPLSVDSKGVPQWVFHNDKTTTDQKRLLSVFGKMGHGKIPVILTSYKLITPPDRHSGVGFEKEGIILEALDFIFWSDPQALSHELGHYAGYNGGPKQNKTHSSSNTNIMYYGIPNGGEPDEIYCTKVKRLAR
jgi:hypothetical protein